MRIERIGSAEVEVEVLPEAGARLHRLRAFGHDLLRTPDDLDAYPRDPFFWGSFVMAPWCNRLAAGPVRVGKATVDLPANFPDGTAIHGQVLAAPWEVVSDGAYRVAGGGDGWPWPYELTMRVTVAGTTVSLALELANRSDQPMPAGLGIHPWFARPLQVAVRAGRVYPANQASPAEPLPVAGRHDLRQLAEMPFDLDATWTDLSGPDPVELRWPRAGVAGTIGVSREGAYLCAASPRSLAAVAVEPQTHAPDGLRRLLGGEPGALRVLAPGERLGLTVEIRLARLPAQIP